MKRPLREYVGAADTHSIEFIRTMYALRGPSNRKRRRLIRAADYVPVVFAIAGGIAVITLIVLWAANMAPIP